MMAVSGRKVYCAVNSCVVLQFILVMFVFVLIHLMSVISTTVTVRMMVNIATPCQPPRQQSVTFFDELLTFDPGDLHLILINHQPNAAVFKFIIPTFVYSSTCFGRFPAHHQELNDRSGSLWYYLPIVVTVVLCSWSGRRPDHEHSTTVTTI
jgi:hypothetical protein